MQTFVDWTESVGDFFGITWIIFTLIGLAFMFLMRRQLDRRLKEQMPQPFDAEERTVVYFRALLGWRDDGDESNQVESIRALAPGHLKIGAPIVLYGCLASLLGTLVCMIPWFLERLEIKDFGLGNYKADHDHGSGLKQRSLDGMLHHLAYVIHAPYPEMIQYLLVDGLLLFVFIKFIVWMAKANESN